MVWIEFIICGAVLTYSAYHLSREGIVLSEKTHIEEGVIGMFFLAVATSFPEIVTSSTAVFSFGKVGLGYGDLIGSVMVNFMLLSGLDLFYRDKRILSALDRMNVLTSVYILGVIFFVVIIMVMRYSGFNLPAVKGVGVESPILLCGYVFYLRSVRNHGARVQDPAPPARAESNFSLWARFIVFLAVVMAAGFWMARIGDRIVERTLLSETFTGTLLLGLVTSLPELIVSFAALRAGSPDMAVGNILGSNLFDLCIIPVLDVLTRAPIMGQLTPGQMFSTFVVLIMSVIAYAGVRCKISRQRRAGLDTISIFVVGFAGFVIIYFLK
jgi:cation:H+ antiporter